MPTHSDTDLLGRPLIRCACCEQRCSEDYVDPTTGVCIDCQPCPQCGDVDCMEDTHGP